MKQSECPICKHPRNIELTNAVLRGEIKISDLMSEVGISDRSIAEDHLKSHIRVISSDDGMVAVEYRQIDSVGVLTELTTKLKDIADVLLDSVNSNGVLDVTNIRLANDTIKEIRGCLKTIGEFTGDLQTKIMVEYQLQTNFTTSLQNFLLQELCDEDKAKFLEWLRENVE
jgi:hypothetical protein